MFLRSWQNAVARGQKNLGKMKGSDKNYLFGYSLSFRRAHNSRKY